MVRQRGSNGVTAKVSKPLLTVPNPRTPQQQAVPVAVSLSPTRLKYIKLLRIIEQLGRDLKPFYTGYKTKKMMPKVQRDLVTAHRLVKQCQVEVAKNAKKSGQ